jgi:methyl-accepting chemotaxis protein
MPALNALPFDAEQKEPLQRVLPLVVELKSDIDTVLQTTISQGHIVSSINKKAEEFSHASESFLELVDEIYSTAEEKGEEAANQVIFMVVGIGLITVIVAVIIAVVIARNITTGIHVIADSMNEVAVTGHVGIELPEKVKSRSDEVGILAGSFSTLMDQFRRIERLANYLASGNWNARLVVRGELDTVNVHLNEMLNQVNEILGQINDSVGQVSTGAGEVSSAATSLSSGAQESAASLEEITSSMSEISNQTKTNAQSASEARDLAQKATDAAAEGQTAMQNMTTAMGKITANASEIQRVIKVIDDIAFQTNLLALNAAVEAARAGTHGKGFAVVAEEVRNLAARSAKAAQETNELISTSGQEIEKGGEVANHTSEVLNTIVEQIKQTTDLVAGIASASNEQAQSVEQVTVGLQQIDSVTQQNTAAAEESASAASEMTSMANNLKTLVAKFQLRE